MFLYYHNSLICGKHKYSQREAKEIISIWISLYNSLHISQFIPLIVLCFSYRGGATKMRNVNKSK